MLRLKIAVINHNKIIVNNYQTAQIEEKTHTIGGHIEGEITFRETFADAMALMKPLGQHY